MNKYKYGFTKLLSQEQNKRLLLRDLQQHSLPKALLFSGPTGSGRRSLAMALAKYLLCENPGPEDACHNCPSCRYVEAGSHPDLRELSSPDGQLIKVDEVREKVIRDLPHRPQFSPHKVYIIEADGLNEQGQNALLKSLEEPPSYAYIILRVESASHLLPTIISRTREYKLQPLTNAEIRQILAREGFPEPPDFLAGYAGHVPGRALALARREDFADLRKETVDLLTSLAEESFLDMARDNHRWLLQRKEYFPDILAIAESYLRDLALVVSEGLALDCRHTAGLSDYSASDRQYTACLPESSAAAWLDKAGLSEQMLNPDLAPQLAQQARQLLGTRGATVLPEQRGQSVARITAAGACLREAEAAMSYNVNYEILTWHLLLGLKENLRIDKTKA